MIFKVVEDHMLCFVFVNDTQVFEALHGTDGRIGICISLEHGVEVQQDVDVDEELDENGEHATNLRLVLLATLVEIKRDQMSKHVFGTDFVF